MNETDLRDLFEQQSAADTNEMAKRRAVNAALDAFDQETLQGSSELPRLTEDNATSSWRNKMLTQRFALSSFASAAAVFLAVLLVFNIDQPTLEPVPNSSILDNDLAGIRKQIPADQNLPATVETLVNEAELRLESFEDKTKIEERVATAQRTLASSDQLSKIALGDAISSGIVTPGRVTPMVSAPVVDDAVTNPHRMVGNDKFTEFDTNAIKLVNQSPISTFSIDVDTSSYSFIRKQLNQGWLPQKAAVRLEEMVNYFPYDYPVPSSSDQPFEPTISVLSAPWNPSNKLIHIGIKGYEETATDLRSNIVFLLDVSGSMNQQDKLPLVKQSMGLLLDQLNPEDTVSIAVYAGAAGTVLPPTQVKEKQKIIDAMNRLSAGGSTAGAAGIKLAYQLAETNFVDNGINRVFLATDGDFNVGITNRDELQGFIERKRDSGIYLSVLGFGQGNYKDELMQKLAQNGNGIAAYIDTLSEAQKVLVDEAKSMLFPIANDVKLQVEFNPATVKEYRLLGYETRMLNTEDFNNDKVDAGEIGAGHSVTAIYEITPTGNAGLVDEHRYGQSAKKDSEHGDEYGFLKIRYKLPGESQSRLINATIPVDIAVPSTDTNFAVAVAGFSQLLKDGKYIGSWGYEDALNLAVSNKGADIYGYRAEFTQLVRAAMTADKMQ